MPDSADGDNSSVVKSLAEYLNAIGDIPMTIPGRAETYCTQRVFRGQSDVSYELVPSIGRNGTAYLPGEGICKIEQKALTNEANYIAAACHRLPELFNTDLDPLDLLARLQHFGIPTRLLDVTTNALAALYFACITSSERSGGKDGEVIVFRCPAYDLNDYPIVHAIADSWRILPNGRGLSDFMNIAIRQPYFRYQKHSIPDGGSSSDFLAKWLKDCCSKLLFVRGNASLQRQTSQSGLYILFPNEISRRPLIYGDDSNSLFFDGRIKAIPKDHTSIARRLIIPADRKQEFLKGLWDLGISEGTLFPDNIDAICSDLKRKVDAAD